jgi:hypothetical protein
MNFNNPEVHKGDTVEFLGGHSKGAQMTVTKEDGKTVLEFGQFQIFRQSDLPYKKVNA